MNIIFAVLMIVVFGRMIGFAIRFTWDIARVIVNIVCLPLALIALVFGGLVRFAIPILAIVGLVTLFQKS